MLILGRALLGLGTAGSLVASLAVYAHRFPPDRFATLTGLQIGFGTVGALLATAPLAFSTATIGWRGSFLAVGVFTGLVGLLIAVVVKDDATARAAGTRRLRESWSGIPSVLRTPSVGRLFVMNLVMYSTFGLIVGLWGGPYLTHIYGYSLEARGSFLLIPVLTQIVGSMLWGPMDRLTGSHKLPVLVGAGCDRRRARLSRAGRNADTGHAGRMVRGLRICQRLRAGPDRAREGAVFAPSGRQGPHASSTWAPWAACSCPRP